jgi:hypothetical protein
MRAGVVLGDELLARHICSYIQNFWGAPPLAQTCAGSAATIQPYVAEFHAAYEQYQEYLNDVFREEYEANLLGQDLIRNEELAEGYVTD